MYGAKKKKSEKFRDFFHRHGHHKRSNSSESTKGNPNWMSAYNPRIVAAPSTYPVSILKPTTTTTTDASIGPSAKFSSDYDRYMTVRRMNMDRIKELNAKGSSNTPHMYGHDTMYDLTEDTVSPLEQDILRMANNYESPYSSSAYASERPPPSAYASPTPYSPYLWEASPKPFYQRTQSTPALPYVLSPHSELEQFRSSFASTPTPYTTTTSSTLALSSSQSPPPISKYDSYYDNKPSYNQQHEGNGKRKLHTSTEFASSPITFCPPYSSSSSYSYPNYNLDDFKPILESPHANRPTFSPLPESEGLDKMHIEDNRAPSPVEEDMIITEQPHIFVDGENGNKVSLEEDLQNLLLNLEQHFGRRPSGLPKAPPPSPADGIASPTKMLDEAIYPDFDFTRDQARLHPRSIASSLSPMQQRRFFSPSSSGPSSPRHSNSPSPTHFRASPVASDSEYYTPPHSPASSNIVSNLSSHSYTPNSVSSILSSSSDSSLPLPPAPVYNHQDLDCQGNFPAPPPPLAFNPDDLHSLPYPNMPPPDFDYSAFDFQGNRIDRPAEDEENINNDNINNDNQLTILQNDNDNELALATYNAEFNQDNKDNEGENENDNEVEHTSSFTTSTTRDDDSTTVSAVMQSTTMSPSVIVATVSTAITTTSTTAIPTTPTSPRRDEPTVIRSLCLTTTAIEPETGHVENSKITKTAISHPHADADSDLSEIIRTSREFDEGFLPPARSSSLNNLLSEIRNGKILKKAKSEGTGLNVQSLSPSLSSISSLPSPSTTLASVLATRRAHMNDDDDIEEDEDQEWI